MENYSTSPLVSSRANTSSTIMDSPAQIGMQGPEQPVPTLRDNVEQPLINTKTSFMDAKKQRAFAQIAITAGFGTAAYFLWNINRTAAIIFAIASAIAGYTVVMPHEREDGSVRPSAIQALKAA